MIDLDFDQTNMAKWLEEENLLIPKWELSFAQKNTLSLTDFIKLFNPRITKSNLNLVKNIIKNKSELDLALLKFLTLSDNHNFNVDRIKLFLKYPEILDLILILEPLNDLLIKSKITFEFFCLNTFNDLLTSADPEENLIEINRAIILGQDTVFSYNFLKENDLIKYLSIETKPSNLNRLHSQVTKCHSVFIKNEKNFTLNLEQNFPELSLIKNKEIDCFTVKYRIVIPQNSYQLCYWGSIMGNCIASYAKRSANKETIVLGLFDDDNNLRINIEISNHRIKQLFKRGNTPVVGEEKICIQKFLLSQNIIHTIEVMSGLELFSEFENLLNTIEN